MISKPLKLDLAPYQLIADNLRHASATMRESHKHASSLFQIASDTIEAMQDAIKAQETLIGSMVDGINKLESRDGQ